VGGGCGGAGVFVLVFLAFAGSRRGCCLFRGTGGIKGRAGGGGVCGGERASACFLPSGVGGMGRGVFLEGGGALRFGFCFRPSDFLDTGEVLV